MNSKKVKALRQRLRASGVAIDDGGNGRKAYRAAKRAMSAPVALAIKPLPLPHSHRMAESRAHRALPKEERNGPWRSDLLVLDHIEFETGTPIYRKYSPPLIKAKHPQRGL